ncbi:hypothetical protein E2C01_069469 [Portunus trituberculatus]|uniref:Uncharacterized protein n=1 Tax=Portunus trituberculatus TaxID=210409 RepID=A0A5B7I2W2_PORTR|nr:hypothetical protein [Portunus trituberculatus]
MQRADLHPLATPYLSMHSLPSTSTNLSGVRIEAIHGIQRQGQSQRVSLIYANGVSSAYQSLQGVM